MILKIMILNLKINLIFHNKNNKALMKIFFKSKYNINNFTNNRVIRR